MIFKRLIALMLTTLVLIFTMTSVTAQAVEPQYYARVVTNVFNTHFTYRISAHDPKINETMANKYLNEVELLSRVVSKLTDNFENVFLDETKANSRVYEVTKENFSYYVNNNIENGKLKIKIEIDNIGNIIGYEEVYFEKNANELTSFLNLIIGNNIENATNGLSTEQNNLKAKTGVLSILKDISDYLEIANYTTSTVNVYQINNRPNERIEIDQLLYDILVLSEEYKAITNGYFDISIGLIIDEWKEIIDFESNYSEDALNKKIENISKIPVIKDGILLEEVDGKYFITIKEGVKIDLGAIAKGYIAGLVDDYFKSKNLTYYNIMGSDSSLLYGKNYYREGNFFHVGFYNPHDPLDKSYVKLKNTSVTTSGDTVQQKELFGNLYHHLISPKTKKPENHYRLLTIIHDDPIFSEALTTAMFAMDEKTLKEFASKNGINDYIVFKTDGSIIEVFNNYEFVEVRTNNPISKTLTNWIIISVIVIFLAGGLLLLTRKKAD